MLALALEGSLRGKDFLGEVLGGIAVTRVVAFGPVLRQNSVRRQVIDLAGLIQRQSRLDGHSRDALTGAKQEYWAEQVDIQRRAAASWIALAEDKRDEALTLMRSAADLEDASEKHVAMENRLWPMRELLLELKQSARALEEFEASLNTARNRLRGLDGAARAAEAAGKPDKARAYYTQIVTLTREAGSERPEVQRAKSFLGSRWAR
jgi:tetratricopeptide (TPR) repeat protein